ncbi:MAG TPA: hypothetical protein VMX13_06035 [Sedimentisphaerales bacterium]|nr:hypothetical protein [Sedimentisphaerales bacterium]
MLDKPTYAKRTRAIGFKSLLAYGQPSEYDGQQLSELKKLVVTECENDA